MIRLNRVSKQCLKLSAAASLAMPNSDSCIFFTVKFDGQVGGDAEQLLLSTADSKQLGGVNVHFYTNASWVPDATRGRIRVWVEGVLVNGATMNLTSMDRFTAGTFLFAIRRAGAKLQLLSCAVAGQPDSPVVLQAEATISTGFTHPQGVCIGNRFNLQPTLFADQSFSRAGQVNAAISDAEISAMAYGATPEDLGKVVAWWAPLSDLSSLGGFVVFNGALSSAEPVYGWTPPVVEDEFGTYERPFRESSLWNQKMDDPVLDTWVIPPCFNPRGSTNKSFPSVSGGVWSTGIYRARPTDPPKVIYPQPNKPGVFDSDADEWKPSITIPHWPADATGASGNDGHCDIIDEEAGVIHSFWILRSDADGRFTARQYGWSPLDGSGFGTGAHYYQGARATGVATCAGMIREHEVTDGKPLFEHALACSLDKTGMAADPAFIPPATIADWDPWVNTGKIPEGALLALPASYDTSRLDRWPLLKKVAETLKVYGAYVVDRNEFTPFSIYVQNHVDWKMSSGVVGWDNAMAGELEYMRTQLRQVISQSAPAGGQLGAASATVSDSLLSLRGPWARLGGGAGLAYDTLKQGLEIPAVAAKTWFTNANGNGMKVAHLMPKIGEYFRLTYNATNKSYFRMNIKTKTSSGAVVDTAVAPLGNGKSAYVRWPGGYIELTATAVAGDVAGVLTAQFVKISEAEYLAATK